MPKQTTKSIKTIEREKRFESLERNKLERLQTKLLQREVAIIVRLKSDLKKKFISQVIKQGYKEVELAREIFQYYYDNKLL
jgi:hypothetical protein